MLAAIIGTVSLFPLIVSKLQYGFPYGKEKVRGVSLGGWLIIEVGFRMLDRVHKIIKASVIGLHLALRV
jgi:hypothetical protein